MNTGAAARRTLGGLTAGASRLVLLATAVLYGGGPLLATLLAPDVPAWLKTALVALTVLASVVPAAAPAVVLAVIPLLPILPSLVGGVPPAVCHVVLLTQVVPVLIRLALDRRSRGPAVFAAGWGLFVFVCAVSVGVELTPDRLRGAPLAQAWRDIASQFPSYVFSGYTTREVSALPRWLALADGLLCALLVHASTTQASRRRVLVAAALGAVATSMFGLVQARTGLGLQAPWQIYDPGIVRINATFVDPNALAAYLALIGPVVLGLALAARGIARVAWLGAFGLVLGALVMTAGRVGLLSLACGCALLLWWVFGRRAASLVPGGASPGAVIWLKRLAVAMALVLASLVTFGTALNIGHDRQTSYLHTWLYTFNLRQPPDAIAKGRVGVWRAVVAMVSDAPAFGVGLGMGVHEFERYRHALGLDTIPQGARLSAHNTFLLVAGDLGMLGMAAFLLALLAAAFGARSAWRALPQARDDLPLLGLGAGLTALLLTMLTGDRIVLREDIIIFTTCAALACVGASRLPAWLRVALTVVALVAVVSWPLRVQARPHEAVTPPEPEGLHDVQSDGLRWTTGYTVIYLPADTRAVSAPIRNLSPGPQVLRVYIDGRRAEERVVPHGDWQAIGYRMPLDGRHTRWRRLTLEVAPTWRAPGDPRDLGIQIGELRIDRFPSPAATDTSTP